MVIYILQTLNKSYIFPENPHPHKIPWPNNKRFNDPIKCLQKHYQRYLPHSFPFISHTFATIRLYVTSSVQFTSVQCVRKTRDAKLAMTAVLDALCHRQLSICRHHKSFSFLGLFPSHYLFLSFDPPSQDSEPQPYDPAQEISISASVLNT